MSELTVGQLKGLAVNNNIISVPAGHTLYAPGSIIQVVAVDSLARSSQGVTSGTILNISGVSATITPKSANSKIMVQARWFGEFNGNGIAWDSMFGISRNGTQVGRQTEGVSSTFANGINTASISYHADDASSTAETMSLFFTDSPGTTSPLTYNLTLSSTANGTVFNNRTVGWANQGGHEVGTSGIILMEIAQ
jgi:hypothetical protein